MKGSQLYLVSYSGGKYYSVHSTMESAQLGAKEAEDNLLRGGNSYPCVEIKEIIVK